MTEPANGKSHWLKVQCFIAGFYLVLMCIQYWPIEGPGTSMVKVPFLCLSALVLLFVFRLASCWKVLVGCGACLLWKFAVAYFQPTPFRWITVAYSVGFFFTYMMFYALVNNGCFSLKNASALLESLLWAYIIVLIVQQVYSLAGGGEWRLMNLYFARMHVLKCQSLSLEPSHSGRILGAVFYALLKLWEYQKGQRLTGGDLWKEHRWLTVCFLYAMISMQSATAMFVLLLLLFYFFSWKYMLPLLILCLMFPVIRDITESHELRRVIDVIDGVMTGNTEAVINADDSASYRVAPMLNMLHADYSDINLWVGHGIDTAYGIIEEDFVHSREILLMGEILDIGIIGYLLSLLLVFSCVIHPAFSLPTLMFFFGVGGSTGNVAYHWGILMIFTISSYFYDQQHRLKNLDGN